MTQTDIFDTNQMIRTLKGLFWKREELQRWIDADCPARKQWAATSDKSPAPDAAKNGAKALHFCYHRSVANAVYQTAPPEIPTKMRLFVVFSWVFSSGNCRQVAKNALFGPKSPVSDLR